MEAKARPLYERRHLAVAAEWLSWTVMAQAGGVDHASPQFAQLQYPTTLRLMRLRQAVVGIPGGSGRADRECALAVEIGMPELHPPR